MWWNQLKQSLKKESSENLSTEGQLDNTKKELIYGEINNKKAY